MSFNISNPQEDNSNLLGLPVDFSDQLTNDSSFLALDRDNGKWEFKSTPQSLETPLAFDGSTIDDGTLGYKPDELLPLQDQVENATNEFAKRVTVDNGLSAENKSYMDRCFICF